MVVIGTICDKMYHQDESSSQTELLPKWHYNINKDQENNLIYKPIKTRNKMPKSTIIQILIAFSIKTNGKKLFDTKSNDSSIAVLHGIKFFSMVWIILGHSYSFSLEWISFSMFTVYLTKDLCDLNNFFKENPEKVKDAPQNIVSQFLANGTFSVDSFFFIR